MTADDYSPNTSQSDNYHTPETQGINTFSEHTLHQSLKVWVAQPGDRFEVEVSGSVIDLVRSTDDGDLLIEIQTGNFSAMKRKLPHLLDMYPVRVVYPIPIARWIVKFNKAGRRVSRRKSPKKGSVYHLFSEMVYLYPLMPHENLSLQVLLVHDEEIRGDDGKGSWRRKGWSICDRRLLEVISVNQFNTVDDLCALLPATLPEQFTTAHLAAAIGQPRRIAQQMAYCLRELGGIKVVGKDGRSLLYALHK